MSIDDSSAAITLKVAELSEEENEVVTMASLLKSFIDPNKNFLAKMHMKAVGNRLLKYGLRYEDLYDPYYDLDTKKALNGLPREIVDARHQRLKRAMDLSMKHEYLPEDLQGSAVPVLRNMNAINFAEMEKVINAMTGKANDGSVSFDKMAGVKFSKFSSGVYGSLFGTPIFDSHKAAILGIPSDKVCGLSLAKKGLTVRNYSTDKPNTPNSLRPLSPHLPVYKPQSNAMFSIFNRISAAFLTVEILLVYLLLQIGSTSFTYYNFYQLFFYSSKLTLLATEITALAVAYHLVYGVGALIRPFKR